MPRVPLPDGPTVAPAETPTPGQSESASPADLGAQAGQATQGLGAAVGQTGDMLFQQAERQQQVVNELNANDLSTSYMKGATGLWNDYSQNQGKNALQALPKFQSDLQDLWQKTLAAAPNPQAQVMLDRGTRYYLNRYFSMGADHANAQLEKWSDQSSADRANEFGNQAAMSINNPVEMDRNIAAGANEIGAAADHKGLDDQSRSALQAAYRGTALRKVADSYLAMGRPQDAMAALSRYDGTDADGHSLIDAGSQAAILNTLHPILLKQQAQSIGDQLLGRTASPAVMNAGGSPAPSAPPPGGQAPATVSPQALFQAISGQESGGNPQAPTSTNGAVGQMQIIPTTFSQYAKPGESIANPADNAAVGQRIISDLSARFDGDPQRVAVGYFSGPGNVSPAGSPTPWVKDVADGNGKTVSSYVSDVTGRLNRANVTAGKAATLAAVDDQFKDNQPLAQAVRSYVNEQYAVASLATTAQQQAQKAAEEGAANTYVSRMMKGDTQNIVGQIADDPNLSSTRKDQLWNIYQNQAQSGLNHDAQTYGPGFWQAYQAVHAAPSDPTRITDPSQLYGRGGPGGDLTLAGIHQLSQEIAGRGTVAGESEAIMKTQFLNNAKGQISGANDGLHILDPRGDDLFLRFLTQVLPAYDAGKVAGKTPVQMLNPDSPDYLGKAIATFARPPAQRMADMMGDAQSPAVQPGATPASPFDPDKASPDDLRQAVQTGKLTRQQGIAIAQKRGFIAAPAPAAPVPDSPSVPLR